MTIDDWHRRARQCRETALITQHALARETLEAAAIDYQSRAERLELIRGTRVEALLDGVDAFV